MLFLTKDIYDVAGWYLKISLKCKSKIIRMNNGPLVLSSVELTHPDTAKVGLGSGMKKAS